MISSQTQARRRAAFPADRSPFRPSAVAAAWRDRSGAFSWLRLCVFLLALAPALWLAAALSLGAAGARPIETALDVTGLWTVRFLILSLAATPLMRVFERPRLIRVRRMLGLTAAVYAGLHFSLFLTHQNFDLLRAATEIATRIYLTIGFVALAGLAALSITSTDRWIRKLGARWRRLHQLVYPITALALLHFLMQSKFDVGQAAFYVGLFGLLMGCRLLIWRRVALSPLHLAAVSLLAVPLTMALELAWHAAATDAMLEYIWGANFELGAGLAPSWRVGGVGLALALAAALTRFVSRRAAKREA